VRGAGRTGADVVRRRLAGGVSPRHPGRRRRGHADVVAGDNAENAGKALRLTYEDRQRLKITTIWACDVDPADRERLYRERKRVRDAARAKAKRAEKGAKTRTVNLSETQPWAWEGISRKTWERRRAVATRAYDATPFPPVSQNVAHTQEQPAQEAVAVAGAPVPGPELRPVSQNVAHPVSQNVAHPVSQNVADTLKEEATNKGGTLGGGIRTGVCVRARPGLAAGIRDIDRERRERKARWLEGVAAPSVPPAPPASPPRPPDEREQLRRRLVAEGCSPEDVDRELREYDEAWWASVFDDSADARGAA
jgi:hypothetical protein